MMLTTSCRSAPCAPRTSPLWPAVSGRHVLGGRRLWLPADGPQVEVLAPGAGAEQFAGGLLVTDTTGRGQAARGALSLKGADAVSSQFHIA